MTELTPPQIKTKFDVHLWWITAVIIAVNVGLFFWQVLHGMDVSNPSTADAIRWGADYAPLTFLTEPMRLLSSMFFHFGLVHLMLNMWALYIFGSVLEQMFGRVYFLALYVLAGLMGSLLSGYIAIQDSYELIRVGLANPELLPRVGAGASGAVMGLGAALTVLSLLPMLPQQRFILDKKTLLIVMGINLAMGFMISGINNAAHIGGMLMGTILAALWYLSQKTQQRWIMPLSLALAACGSYWFYLHCQNLVTHIQPLWSEVLMMMRQQLNF